MPRRRCFWAVCSFFVLSMVVLAQRDLGTITGTVTDPQGAAVPITKFTLVEDATGVSYDLLSNEAGSYTRPALKPGVYTATVEAQGFQKALQKEILISSGGQVAVNFSLTVGSST